jgi:Holliday junction resolvase RusA-like endonuclease
MQPSFFGDSLDFILPCPPSVNQWKNRVWLKGRGYTTILTRAARAYKTFVSKTLVATQPLLAGDLTVEVTWYRPRKQGDIDNIAKILFDCLQGVAYLNDGQIRRQILERDDSQPRCPRVEVTVRPYANSHA